MQRPDLSESFVKSSDLGPFSATQSLSRKALKADEVGILILKIHKEPDRPSEARCLVSPLPGTTLLN